MGIKSFTPSTANEETHDWCSFCRSTSGCRIESVFSSRLLLATIEWSIQGIEIQICLDPAGWQL